LLSQGSHAELVSAEVVEPVALGSVELVGSESVVGSVTLRPVDVDPVALIPVSVSVSVPVSVALADAVADAVALALNVTAVLASPSSPQAPQSSESDAAAAAEKVVQSSLFNIACRR